MMKYWKRINVELRENTRIFSLNLSQSILFSGPFLRKKIHSNCYPKTKYEGLHLENDSKQILFNDYSTRCVTRIVLNRAKSFYFSSVQMFSQKSRLHVWLFAVSTAKIHLCDTFNWFKLSAEPKTEVQHQILCKAKKVFTVYESWVRNSNILYNGKWKR